MNVQSFQVLVSLTSPFDFSTKVTFFPVFYHFMFGNLNFGVLKFCALVSEMFGWGEVTVIPTL